TVSGRIFSGVRPLRSRSRLDSVPHLSSGRLAERGGIMSRVFVARGIVAVAFAISTAAAGLGLAVSSAGAGVLPPPNCTGTPGPPCRGSAPPAGAEELGDLGGHQGRDRDASARDPLRGRGRLRPGRNQAGFGLPR